MKRNNKSDLGKGKFREWPIDQNSKASCCGPRERSPEGGGGADLGGMWLWHLGLILQEIENIQWFLREVRFDPRQYLKSDLDGWGGVGQHL